MYTSFAGVTLHNSTTIRQVAPYDMEGNRAVSRVFRLSNGTIFDADGTADGTVTYGTVSVTFRVAGANPAAVNATLATLQGLLNKRGSLVGVEYGAVGGANKTCTARCIEARPSPRAGLPIAVGRTYQAELEMTFLRLTAYS